MIFYVFVKKKKVPNNMGPSLNGYCAMDIF